MEFRGTQLLLAELISRAQLFILVVIEILPTSDQAQSF